MMMMMMMLKHMKYSCHYELMKRMLVFKGGLCFLMNIAWFDGNAKTANCQYESEDLFVEERFTAFMVVKNTM